MLAIAFTLALFLPMALFSSTLDNLCSADELREMGVRLEQAQL